MDAAYTAVHIEEDREHWWFRGRLAVLVDVLRRMLPERRLRLLELGCGTGNVLAALGAFGETVGMEPDPDLQAVARAAGLDVRAGRLPDDLVVEPGWADVLLLLDVIEHVDDDAGALRTARAALRPGGWLVVTVPAYQWLWSAHDDILGHRRRYTAGALAATVRTAGFSVERVTYMNSILLPPIAVARLLGRLRRAATHDLRRPAPPVNRALAAIFGFERHVVRWVNLPFGSSVLLLGRG